MYRGLAGIEQLLNILNMGERREMVSVGKVLIIVFKGILPCLRPKKSLGEKNTCPKFCKALIRCAINFNLFACPSCSKSVGGLWYDDHYKYRDCHWMKGER